MCKTITSMVRHYRWQNPEVRTQGNFYRRDETQRRTQSTFAVEGDSLKRVSDGCFHLTADEAMRREYVNARQRMESEFQCEKMRRFRINMDKERGHVNRSHTAVPSPFEAISRFVTPENHDIADPRNNCLVETTCRCPCQQILDEELRTIRFSLSEGLSKGGPCKKLIQIILEYGHPKLFTLTKNFYRAPAYFLLKTDVKDPREIGPFACACFIRRRRSSPTFLEPNSICM